MKTFKQIFGNELRWVKGLTPVGIITLFAIFIQAFRTLQYVESGKTFGVYRYAYRSCTFDTLCRNNQNK